MMESILFLIGGLVALVIGGELLVRGAVGLAEKAGISPLVIGLVIVGFGTSMPELVTSIEAALAGSPAIAWGNIVGSNIANVFLILGVAALVMPVPIRSASPLRDPMVALLASVALLLLAITGIGNALVGAVLVAALLAYVFWCYREETQAAPQVVHNAPYDRAQALELADPGLHQPGGGFLRPVLLTVVGLAVLIGGGRLLVTGAIDLARLAGLTETLIGLTIVAVGTSLPELVTSVIAARKGEAEVAFGNVVGSCIYNLLGIGGATMLLAPGSVPRNLMPVDIGVMIGGALAVVLLTVVFRKVGRISAGALIAAYAAYLTWLISTA